jgi:hypothetical protein
MSCSAHEDSPEQVTGEGCQERLVRHWVDTGYDLPEEGEWVLHTYYGVRPPEYGIFINGRFCRQKGPESFPTTHWLRIPFIDMPNAKSAGTDASENKP